MSRQYSPWKALLCSVLAYCGSSSEQRNPDAGDQRNRFERCLDGLPCAEDSAETQCGPVSLYGVFTMEEALEQCLDEYEIYVAYGPYGDLACADSNPKRPFEIWVTPCSTNTPKPFAGMEFNKAILYRRRSTEDLEVYCRTTCSEAMTAFVAPAPALLPERQVLLLHTGMHADNLELLLALYPSRVEKKDPCFRIGYCVVSTGLR